MVSQKNVVIFGKITWQKNLRKVNVDLEIIFLYGVCRAKRHPEWTWSSTIGNIGNICLLAVSGPYLALSLLLLPPQKTSRRE